ncbi:MAG: DUF4235 domain-containing protein [Solirubrobacteraceae bacterium]
MKLLYAPVGIVSGLVAGVLGRKLFSVTWAILDEQAPPKPAELRASWPKLLIALALEGAVFKLVKGAVDHATRRGFTALTGRWPGESGEPQ